jgi:hypothetical protein
VKKFFLTRFLYLGKLSEEMTETASLPPTDLKKTLGELRDAVAEEEAYSRLARAIQKALLRLLSALVALLADLREEGAAAPAFQPEPVPACAGIASAPSAASASAGSAAGMTREKAAIALEETDACAACAPPEPSASGGESAAVVPKRKDRVPASAGMTRETAPIARDETVGCAARGPSEASAAAVLYRRPDPHPQGDSRCRKVARGRPVFQKLRSACGAFACAFRFVNVTYRPQLECAWRKTMFCLGFGE